jgi:RNA polymerase sigma-70 factor (ECF subfamily)
MTARADSAERGGSTSRSLLDHAREADPAAWERLVTLYAPLVAAWCRRWGVRPQDTVDVLQEVFCAVSSHLQRFRKERPADTFRGWLLTIARNKVHDHFRRAAGQPDAAGGTEALMRLQQVVDEGPPAVGEEHGSDPAFNQVLVRALESIRGDFQEQTWRAFWGVVVEGRAAADVGADLGMRPGTVRVAKSRVLLRLRKELGDVDV